MIAYIKGRLDFKAENYVIIDVQGIGYKVFMPVSGINEIGEVDIEVKVHTYYYVREDNISLYGFNTREELQMFELLLSVSGIGAKTASAMLSAIKPSAFALAVISNDIKVLTGIPGIGSKSAQRIILELKDKLKTVQAVDTENVKAFENAQNRNESVDEAVSALQVLGYNKKEIDKVILKLNVDTLSVEEIIKQSLKYLGK